MNREMCPRRRGQQQRAGRLTMRPPGLHGRKYPDTKSLHACHGLLAKTCGELVGTTPVRMPGPAGCLGPTLFDGGVARQGTKCTPWAW